jgi:signal transduction histidine kinase
VIRRKSGEDEKIRSATEHIGKAIARGRQITGDIRLFARSEDPAVRELDLGTFLQSLLPAFVAVAGTAVEVRLPTMPAGMIIAVDPVQLRQILDHLVSNARDAMPRGGALTVSAAPAEAGESFSFGVVPDPENFVHLAVTDTGEGIAKAVLPSIFEPLFTTKGRGSTGLGLAIAHHLVTRNKGYIFPETAESAGTSFHLFLPLARGGRL